MLTHRNRTFALMTSLLLTVALSAPGLAKEPSGPSTKDLPKCQSIDRRPSLQISPAAIPVGVPTEVTVTARSAKGNKPIANLGIILNGAFGSLSDRTDDKGRLTVTVTPDQSEVMQLIADEDPSVTPAYLYALESDQSAMAIRVADRCGHPLSAEVTVTPADPAQEPWVGATEEGLFQLIHTMTDGYVTAKAQAEDGRVAYFLHQSLSARTGQLTEVMLSAEKLKPTYVHFQTDGTATHGQLYLLPSGVEATQSTPVVEHEQHLYAPEGIYQYLVVGASGTQVAAGESALAKHDWLFNWSSADLVPLQANLSLEGTAVTVRGLGLRHGAFYFGVANGARLTPGEYGVFSLSLQAESGERAVLTRTNPVELSVHPDEAAALSLDLQFGEPTLLGLTTFGPGQILRLMWQHQTTDGWSLRSSGLAEFHVTLADPSGELVIDELQYGPFIRLPLPKNAAPSYTLTVTGPATAFTPESSVTTTLYRR